MSADLEAVRDRLARSPGELTPHRVAEALRETGRPVGDAAVLAVYETLRRDVVGAGPLEPLLRTPRRHRRAGQRRRTGSTSTAARASSSPPVRFPDEEAVRRLAQRLAALGGRRLDDATPYVDLRLPDGTRFHAVLAPLARPGTADLAAGPAAADVQPRRAGRRSARSTPDTARLLDAIVEARLAFLVSGGTGSGKTTLLAALLVPGRAGRADRPGRGRQRAATRPSARRRARGPAGQHRGRRRGRGAHPGAAGAADATRPAGRRRGARRRGRRPAGRPQHRARGRLRHPARQLRARRARPGRGAGARRRPGPRRPRTASSPPPSHVVLHLARGPDGVRRLRQVAVPDAGRRRPGRRCCRRSTSTTSGRGRPRAGRRRSLAARLGAMTVARRRLRGAGGPCCWSGRRPRLPRPGSAAGAPVAAARSRCCVGVRGRGRRAASSAPWRWCSPRAAAGAAGLWRRRRRRRAAEAVAAQVLETCELLAGELAAGRPPGEALDRAAAAWPPLRAGRRGVPGRRRRARRAARPGRRASTAPRDLRVVAAAWQVAHRTGEGLGAAVDRVAESLRAAGATRRVVAGELASARATARLVAGPAGAGAGDGLGRRRRPVGLPARHSGRAGLPGGRARRSGSPGCGGSRRSPARRSDAGMSALGRRRCCAARGRRPRCCRSGRRCPARRVAPAAAGRVAWAGCTGTACWWCGLAGVGAAAVRRRPGRTGRRRRRRRRRLGRDRPRRAGRGAPAARGGPPRPAARRRAVRGRPCAPGAAPGDGIAAGLRRAARARGRPAVRRSPPGSRSASTRSRSGRRWPTTRSSAASVAPWPGPRPAGAPVVAAVERLADELARTARAETEERARAVGVKAAVPLGLCLLPAFVLIGIVPLVVALLRRPRAC